MQNVVAGKKTWFVAEEIPVAFVFNQRNYSIMMATPDDLVDFGLGFSLSEEVIKHPNEVKSLEVLHSKKGIDLKFKISIEAIEKLDIKQRKRNLVGSASCGLCGLESSESLYRILPSVGKVKMKIDTANAEKAISALHENQLLNSKTHSVHAAAWVNSSGEIIITREDVGRHNALDKLLGAMALQSINTANGYVLMSSRCSYEIVEKSAKRGIKAIVSISGPTAFALRKANEANITLYSLDKKRVIEIKL
ncbi:MAG: formate dehydrogenase accessory sulfurtransferase FdhD [Rhodospirillaceae bacterium]|nr:formate dehydrogenase accessory sulfurtransferase FdhD [Rhodospirillaceae bacterium]